MKSEHRRVSEIIKRTVVELCKTGLAANNLQIRGVIGITVNASEVFIVHIDEDVEEVFESAQSICDDTYGESSVPNQSASSGSKSESAMMSSFSSRDVKKRLVFPVAITSEEKKTELHVDDTLPDLTTTCEITRSDGSCENYCDDDTLVVIDSEEEECIGDSFSVDDDCVMADPGVSSLCIASVVGSGGQSRRFLTCNDNKVSRTSPSVKQESAQKAFLQPVSDPSILRTHSNGVFSYPISQKSENLFETPPKLKRVSGTPTPSRLSSSRGTPSRSMSRVSLTSPISLPNSLTKSQCFSESRRGSPLNTNQAASNKPLFRTMFVCNIGRCSQGFAYKQVLVRHQQQKHHGAVR